MKENFVLTAAERRLAVAKMQGGFYCYYCESTDLDSLVIDHIIPQRHGGTDDLRNLVLACNSCNIRKLDRNEDSLRNFGHETLADKIVGLKAMRAHWGINEVKYALAQEIEGIDPGYNQYEKFITETKTAKVINAALIHASKSAERVRKELGLGGWTLDRLRLETSRGSIKMWHRLSEATGYPIHEFLKVYRGWKTLPNTVHRELEYAAACVNLTFFEISQVLGYRGSEDLLVLQNNLKVTPIKLAELLQISLSKAEKLIDKLNATVVKPFVKAKKSGPVLRPVPIPNIRPNSYICWYDLCDRFIESLDIPSNTVTTISLYLGLSAWSWSTLKNLVRFPNVDLFRYMCGCINENPEELLFKLESEILRSHNIILPSHLQAPQRSLEYLMYLQNYTDIPPSMFTWYKRRKELPIKEINLLAEQLSVSKNTIHKAFTKTLWMYDKLKEIPRKELIR